MFKIYWAQQKCIYIYINITIFIMYIDNSTINIIMTSDYNSVRY